MSYVLTGGGRATRHAAFLAGLAPTEAERVGSELARLHPLSRIGRTG